MSQLLGHRDNIRTVCRQDGGNGVAEGMGIDVGQIVAGGEIFEPAGDAVRVHGLPVVLGEYKAGIDPAVAVGNL